MINKKSALAIAGTAFTLSACADVKPQVAQFGTATVTAKSAESSFINALNQKRLDQQNIEFVAQARFAKYNASENTYHWPAPLATDPASAAVTPETAAAINSLLKPIQDYGNAMLALSTDNAPATFATNISDLATQSTTFEQQVLTRFGARGLPSGTTLANAGKAIGDLGNIVIQAMISHDVQRAANSAKDPMAQIVNGIKQINGDLTRDVEKGQTGSLNSTVLLILTHPTQYPLTMNDTLSLKTALEKNLTPVPATEANSALDALLTTNGKIADAGPKDATAEIQVFLQAANDAYSFYSSFMSK